MRHATHCQATGTRATAGRQPITSQNSWTIQPIKGFHAGLYHSQPRSYIFTIFKKGTVKQCQILISFCTFLVKLFKCSNLKIKSEPWCWPPKISDRFLASRLLHVLHALNSWYKTSKIMVGWKVGQQRNEKESIKEKFIFREKF